MLLCAVWALLTLTPCPGSTEMQFEVSIWPDRALVNFGQSLTVNCSTTCANPGPSGIETLLKKTQVGRGPQWKEFLLEDITKSSILQCFFSCSGIQKDTSLDIIVYRPPEQVILELQPAWVAVNAAFTVSCSVPRVAPLENLTLTLIQGSQELRKKSFLSVPGASRVGEVTVNVSAQREDDECRFSCHAELDLSAYGGELYHSSSATEILRIFEFSQTPQIWVSPLLEVGMAAAVSCEMAEVFPAKDTTFHMFLGDQELSPFFSWAGDTAWANATVRAMETGDQELSCLVSLGPMEQKSRKPVYVYSFPPPVLEIAEPYPLAGTAVNVTCSGHVLTSPSPTVQLQGAADLPTPPKETAWLLLTAREEDDGRNFSCEASLEVQGQQLVKTTSAQLHVLYEPRLEESSCPGNQTWVAGAEERLACVPKGNPAPALVCTWNGVAFNLEVPQMASQNHTGAYRCTASNRLGSVSKDITIVVEGLKEGIGSTIFVIVIVALGMGVVTTALYLNYRPCKMKRRLPYLKEQEEGQCVVQEGRNLQLSEPLDRSSCLAAGDLPAGLGSLWRGRGEGESGEHGPGCSGPYTECLALSPASSPFTNIS